MTPEELAKLLHGGQLEQACAICGIWEAAGAYCSRCHRRTGPEDWYRNGDAKRRAAIIGPAPERPGKRPQTPGKGGSRTLAGVQTPDGLVAGLDA